MGSKFDQLVQNGADLLMELRRLESAPKLTAPAFVAAALHVAGATMAEAAAARHTIAEHLMAHHARAFVRRVASMFREPSYPAPPKSDKVARMERAYGREELLPELSSLGISLPLAVAVAALDAAERFPDAFGPVTDLAGYLARVAELRAGLDNLYDEMRTATVPGIDLEMSAPVAASDRQRALVHVRLRRWPNIPFGDAHWPRLLLEHVVTSPDPANVAEQHRSEALRSGAGLRPDPTKPAKRSGRRRLAEAASAVA